MYSLFTDEWIIMLDGHRSDEEVEEAWSVIERQTPEIRQ